MLNPKKEGGVKRKGLIIIINKAVVSCMHESLFCKTKKIGRRNTRIRQKSSTTKEEVK